MQSATLTPPLVYMQSDTLTPPLVYMQSDTLTPPTLVYMQSGTLTPPLVYMQSDTLTPPLVYMQSDTLTPPTLVYMQSGTLTPPLVYMQSDTLTPPLVYMQSGTLTSPPLVYMQSDTLTPPHLHWFTCSQAHLPSPTRSSTGRTCSTVFTKPLHTVPSTVSSTRSVNRAQQSRAEQRCSGADLNKGGAHGLLIRASLFCGRQHIRPSQSEPKHQTEWGAFYSIFIKYIQATLC